MSDTAPSNPTFATAVAPLPGRVDLRLRLARFQLPPVQSALVIGKRALIGSRAMSKALDEMMPGSFRRIEIDHPIIEAILIRDAHLRRVPEARLVPVIVRHAENFMSEADTLHFDIEIEVLVSESFDL
jgi:hypothetical protein